MATPPSAPVSDPLSEPNAGERLAQECREIMATTSALYAVAVEVLAHRAPIFWATSPAPIAIQLEELWRMNLEKPFSAWQACAGLGLWPFAAAGLMARAAACQAPAETLALALAADGTSAMRAALDAMHEQVAANAARLRRAP